MDLFKDFLVTWSSRLRSSLFTFIVGSLLVANWKIIFFLFSSSESASVRIRFADYNFDYSHNLLYPFLAGVFLAMAFPWLAVVVEAAISIPVKWSRRIQEWVSHSVELKRVENSIEIESRREERLRIREKAALERARVDEEARKFGVENEIAQIREETEADELNSKYAVSDGKLSKEQLDGFDVAVIDFLGRASNPQTLTEMQESKDIAVLILSAQPETKMTRTRLSVMVEASVLKLYRGKVLLKDTGHYTLSKYGYELFDKIVS